MKQEVFDDPKLFMAAVTGTSRRASKRAREARPDVPRAPRPARGEGDRLTDLGRLAAVGLMPRYRAGVGFDCWATDGRRTQVCLSYGAAIDAALAQQEQVVAGVAAARGVHQE